MIKDYGDYYILPVELLFILQLKLKVIINFI